MRRLYDRTARPDRHRFYHSASWQKLRAAHLQMNPLCVECARTGRSVPGEHVDHIVPRAIAPERELDPTNLQSLCAPHHSRKTRAEATGTPT